MRRLQQLVLMCFVLIAGSTAAQAEAWLESIRGSGKHVELKRGGKTLPVKELMRLEAGDELSVSSQKTTVSVLLGSGAVRKISKPQSPFVLPGGGKTSSLFGNLVREARNMTAEQQQGDTQTVAMITRGDADKLKLLAIGAEESFALPSDELVFAWIGGEKPYAVKLVNEDTDEVVLERTGIEERQARLETGALEAGIYRLSVLGKSGKRPSETLVSVLEMADLSDEAQQLLKMKIEDKRVEARLLISLLHKEPEWRFFTHSLAMQYRLDRERGIVLSQR